MRELFLLTISLLLISSLPTRASEEPFTVKAKDLKQWCELDAELCMLWIQGVMEGMEFAQIMMVPEEIQRDKNVFCINDVDTYMDEIRMSFMNFISEEKNNAALDHPAVLSLAVSFTNYLCR